MDAYEPATFPENIFDRVLKPSPESVALIAERLDQAATRAQELSKKYPKTASALLLHSVIPPPEIVTEWAEIIMSLELDRKTNDNSQHMIADKKGRTFRTIVKTAFKLAQNLDPNFPKTDPNHPLTEEEGYLLKLSTAQSRRIDNILETYKHQLQEPIAAAASHSESYPSPLKYQLESYRCLAEGIEEMGKVIHPQTHPKN